MILLSTVSTYKHKDKRKEGESDFALPFSFCQGAEAGFEWPSTTFQLRPDKRALKEHKAAQNH